MRHLTTVTLMMAFCLLAFSVVFLALDLPTTATLCSSLAAAVAVLGVFARWVVRWLNRPASTREIIRQHVLSGEIESIKAYREYFEDRDGTLPDLQKAKAAVKKVFNDVLGDEIRKLARLRKNYPPSDRLSAEMADYLVAARHAFENNGFPNVSAELVLRFAAQWRWAETGRVREDI